jgi:hypothetical protein
MLTHISVLNHTQLLPSPVLAQKIASFDGRSALIPPIWIVAGESAQMDHLMRDSKPLICTR